MKIKKVQKIYLQNMMRFQKKLKRRLKTTLIELTSLLALKMKKSLFQIRIKEE